MSINVCLRCPQAPRPASRQRRCPRLGALLAAPLLFALWGCGGGDLPADSSGRRTLPDMGGPLVDPIVRCETTHQVFDRATGACVELPACVPTLQPLNWVKGPKSPDGWSAWTPDAPRPTADLSALHGSDAANAWIVGGGGTILAWQGLAWMPQVSGTSEDLNGVWSANPCIAWALGNNGALLSWDGLAWKTESSGTTAALHGIWGADAHDIWAVGRGGTLLHYDGLSWSAQPSGTTKDLFAVWGSDREHVFAVGQDGVIVTLGSSGWSPQASGTDQTLRSLWGSSRWFIWAVGMGGTLLKYDGTTWIKQPSGTAADLYSIHGLDIGPMWAVGTGGVSLAWGGYSWTSGVMGDQDLLAAWGSGGTKRWAVGKKGSVLSYRVSPEPGQPAYDTSVGSVDARAVFGTSATNLWVAGDPGLILHWDGTTWRQHRSGSALPLRSVFSTGPDNAWAVGGNTPPSRAAGVIVHWDGMAWGPVHIPEGGPYYSIWGTAPNRLWAVAKRIMTWDGSQWATDSRTSWWWPSGVFGLDDRHIWVFGAETVFLGNWLFPYRSAHVGYWDGSTWREVYSDTYRTSAELDGLWASSPTQVWVLGKRADGNTRIWTLFENIITTVPSPASNRLYGIFGSDANNVYVVGEAGTVMRWNGAKLQLQNVNGYARNLYAVWAANANQAWAVGDGVILQHE